jgi:hypothetical protein
MSAMRKGPGSRHTMVLHLEPKRAATTVGCVVMMLIAIGVVVAALNFPEIWPRPNPPEISDQTLSIIEAIAGFVALLFLWGAIHNGRRWRTARAIRRLSDNPKLSSFMPQAQLPEPVVLATTIPQLDITLDRARKYGKHQEALRPITSATNIIGYPPPNILYLRLFDNQPRMRTFIEGAWREFGYVYMLRSATSVTPRELRAAKGHHDFGSMFVDSDEELWAFCESCGHGPSPKGRRKFDNIAPTKIRVKDKFGSYPARALLCHGSFWQSAVTRLLAKMDLVALDLSGFTESNAGTRFEIQRVVNTFPIERVVFLADANTNERFIAEQLRSIWSQMAAGSPNATPGTRTAVIAVTDFFVKPMSDDGPLDQTNIQLRSRRSQTRQVALNAQKRILALHPNDASATAVG